MIFRHLAFKGRLRAWKAVCYSKTHRLNIYMNTLSAVNLSTLFHLYQGVNHALVLKLWVHYFNNARQTWVKCTVPVPVNGQCRGCCMKWPVALGCYNFVRISGALASSPLDALEQTFICDETSIFKITWCKKIELNSQSALTYCFCRYCDQGLNNLFDLPHPYWWKT